MEEKVEQKVTLKGEKKWGNENDFNERSSVRMREKKRKREEGEREEERLERGRKGKRKKRNIFFIFNLCNKNCLCLTKMLFWKFKRNVILKQT